MKWIWKQPLKQMKLKQIWDYWKCLWFIRIKCIWKPRREWWNLKENVILKIDISRDKKSLNKPISIEEMDKNIKESSHKMSPRLGTSLVVHWLRTHLPMQGTRVRFLVQEDPTWHRATKPMHHNYWACALEPTSYNYWARVLQLLKPACLEPMLLNRRSHCSEKPTHCNEK